MVNLSLFFQGHTEIVIGFASRGIQGDGLPVGDDGFIQLFMIPQGIAEVAVGFGTTGLEGEGLTKGRFRKSTVVVSTAAAGRLVISPGNPRTATPFLCTAC